MVVLTAELGGAAVADSYAVVVAAVDIQAMCDAALAWRW